MNSNGPCRCAGTAGSGSGVLLNERLRPYLTSALLGDGSTAGFAAWFAAWEVRVAALFGGRFMPPDSGLFPEDAEAGPMPTPSRAFIALNFQGGSRIEPAFFGNGYHGSWLNPSWRPTRLFTS